MDKEANSKFKNMLNMTMKVPKVENHYLIQIHKHRHPRHNLTIKSHKCSQIITNQISRPCKKR
jgi:hypothetical protein